MGGMMRELIPGDPAEVGALVDRYIDESTGIQTIHQMRWLAETVHARGMNPGAPTDPWWYKNEYNRRLMERVGKRVEALKNGELPREAFLMYGSVACLETLRERGYTGTIVLENNYGALPLCAQAEECFSLVEKDMETVARVWNTSST